MTAAEPPVPGVSARDAAGALLEEGPPPVVAVVVTRNPGAFLEPALGALGAQDYPALTVLVADAGSDRDPTDRVAAALPGTFVHHAAPDSGFGGAVNEAVASVDGATFLLLCHDDAVLGPAVVRLLVEEAYRSNAAIVGPKLVSAEDPRVLLEVGRAIDHLGGAHTGIEPGELDQEQHDGVRDVFYVSSAVMLVRADLFGELGGFDADAFPGSEDLDLCWRARLAGARVIVAPDARAAHVMAATRRQPGDRPDERDLARRRVRVLLSAYSPLTLLWVVPFGLFLSFVEAVVFTPTRRRRTAWAAFGAWWWNLLYLGRVRAARHRTQALRQIHDSEVRELQVGASARFGEFLTQHHADERLQSIGERGRDVLMALGDALRSPASLGLLAVLVLVLIGSRELFSQGVPSVGTLVPWPGVRSLGDAFGSAWRYTSMGSTTAAPPALVMMGGLGTVLLGGVGLAQTLVVVGSFVVGASGALRLVRVVGGSYGAAVATAVVYAANPVPRNAVANGRLGPLVLFAGLPFLATLLVRTARFDGLPWAGRRSLLGLVLVTAVVGAWYPPALLAGPVVALAVLLAAPFAGEAAAAGRALGAAVVAALGATLLLLPWSMTFADARSDPSAFGIAFRPGLDLLDVVRFETGPSGAGIATYGFLLAALAALLLARGPRLAWAVRGWTLAIVGYALVYLPSRLAPDSLVAAPEAGLTLAALGIAVAGGVAVGGLGQRLRRARLGWRPVVLLAAAAGVGLGVLGLVGDTVDGRWRAPEGDWAAALAFTRDFGFQGDFRILWIGDPSVLPLDPVDVDGRVSYVLTRNGPGDGRELWRAPEKRVDRFVAEAVQAAVDRRTSRLGRVLGALGIRYVVVPILNGPSGARGEPSPAVPAGLADQLDLARLRTDPGLVAYENQSWVPARAVVPARANVPRNPRDPLRAIAGTGVDDARPLRDGGAAAGTVLLAEAYDPGWSAESDGSTLAHRRAFGLTNAFDHPEAGAATIAHDGQGRRYALVAAEVALWVAALVWWGWGRRRAATPRPARPRADGERPRPRRDDWLDLDDDVAFWERG